MKIDSETLGFSISGNITDIACGSDHSVVLTDTGALYATGKNTYKQLANGNTQSSSKLVLMDTATNITSGTVVKVDCGERHTMVLTNEGQVYGGGSCYYGQLGINATGVNKSLFVKTWLTNADGNVLNEVSGTVTDIACGFYNSYILTDTGNVYSCGRNDFGQIGNGVGGTSTSKFPKLQLVTITGVSGTITNIASGDYHFMVLTDGGKVYSCGKNDYGQLGLGNDTNQSTLQEVTLTGYTPSQIFCEKNVSFILAQNDETGNYVLLGAGLDNGVFNKGGNGTPILEYTTFTEINPPSGQTYSHIGGMAKGTTVPSSVPTITSLLTTNITDEPTVNEGVLNLDNASLNTDLNSYFYNNKTIDEKRTQRKNFANEMLKKYSTQYNNGNKLHVNRELFDLEGSLSGFTKIRLFNSSALTDSSNRPVNQTTTINMTDLASDEGFYVPLADPEDSITINATDGETVSITNKDAGLYHVNDNGTLITGLEAGYTFDKYGIQFTIGSAIGGEGTISSSSNICFVASTPVQTDQGREQISKLIPGYHTIDGKQIKAITETVTKDKFIYKIKRNAFEKNKPSRETIVSGNHLIEFEGFLVPTRSLEGHPNIELVRYNGERLYNILMDKHEVITINNMKVETLHPNNLIARLFTNESFKNMDKKEKNEFIKKFNKKVGEMNLIKYQ